MVRQGLGAERHWGRYSSAQEWRSAVNKRRDASAPIPLFLQDLLQDLRQVSPPPFAAFCMESESATQHRHEEPVWHPNVTVQDASAG